MVAIGEGHAASGLPGSLRQDVLPIRGQGLHKAGSREKTVALRYRRQISTLRARHRVQAAVEPESRAEVPSDQRKPLRPVAQPSEQRENRHDYHGNSATLSQNAIHERGRQLHVSTGGTVVLHELDLRAAPGQDPGVAEEELGGAAGIRQTTETEREPAR